jgi:hypothetical protein
VSVGREIGRAYVSADYSTSLAFVRFTRSNGLTIERRPHTKRVSGSVVAYVGGAISLHGTVDRTVSDDVTDLRVLSGISYRLP